MKRLGPIVLAAWILSYWALSRLPPLPGVEVGLAWDANPTNEEVLSYQVYQASNVIGPWELVLTVTNTNATIRLPSPRRAFWYVTASNYWGESGPSNITNTPSQAGKVNGLGITRPPT